MFLELICKINFVSIPTMLIFLSTGIGCLKCRDDGGGDEKVAEICIRFKNVTFDQYKSKCIEKINLSEELIT